MKVSKLTGGCRFQKWIEKGDLPPSNAVYFIDIYNQLWNKEGISGAIHTRISEGNYWWVTTILEK